MPGPLLSYTDEFFDILDEIEDKVSDALMRIEKDPVIDNQIGIQLVDKSKNDWSFEVKINDKWRPMKTGSFIRYFFGDEFSEDEIRKFTQKYNLLKKGGDPKLIKTTRPGLPVSKSVKVEVPVFVFNPKDVRRTFISLVTETYPHGHEEEVVPFIRAAGLTKDEFGNYFKVIGKSETMFTSHLDTADRKKSKVTLYSEMKDGDEHFMSDGTTILGADDKAGVTVMLYMIAHNIPGVYYFFMGEERGGLGSSALSGVFEQKPHLKDIKRCVSFDRRNYYSIITEQICVQSCSDEFAQALANQYNSKGMKFSLDPTGIYTDSASFIDQIPECTNISVGYFDEHTTRESQNITFLEKLAKASVEIKWEELPTVKKVGVDEEILSQYADLINEFKETAFNMEVKLSSAYGKTYIKATVDEPDVAYVQDDLLNLATLFNKHNLDPQIEFDDDTMFMELEKQSTKSRFGRFGYRRFVDSYSTFIKEDWDDLDDWDEYQYKPSKFGREEEENVDEIEEDKGEGQMGELAYWIRQMLKKHNLNCVVETDQYDLEIFATMKMKERIKSILTLFEVISEIKEELLAHYDCEVELYETSKGDPVFKFNFIWWDAKETGKSKDKDLF